MKSKVLLVILAISLVCAWGGVGAAGQIGYSMRSAEKGFAFKPDPDPPSSSVMAVDALIGRPLGLATTIVGTGVFLVTLPFTLPSEYHRRGGLGVGGPARRVDLYASPGTGRTRYTKNRASFSLNRPQSRQG